MSGVRGSAAMRSRPPPASEDVEKAYALADALRGVTGRVAVVGSRSSVEGVREELDVEVLRRWLDKVVGERVAR